MEPEQKIPYSQVDIELLSLQKLQSQTYQQIQFNLQGIIRKHFCFHSEVDSSDSISRASLKLIFNSAKSLYSVLKFNSCLRYPLALYLLEIYSHQTQESDLGSFCTLFYYQTLNSLLKFMAEYQESLSQTSAIEFIVEEAYKYGLSLIDKTQDPLLNIEEMGFSDPSSSADHIRGRSVLRSSNVHGVKSSKMVKIINSLLCVPEKYLSISAILSIFKVLIASADSSLSLNNKKAVEESLVFEVLKKTEYNLCQKLRKYPTKEFEIDQIKTLLNLVMLGEPESGQFLRAMLEFEEETRPQWDFEGESFNREYFESRLSSLSHYRQSSVNVGYHLLCFCVENIIGNKVLDDSVDFKERALILAIKYLKQRFTDHIQLYNILVRGLIHQKSELCLIYLRFIQIQSLEKFSVQKVKSLLKALEELSRQLQKSSKKDKQSLEEDVYICQKKISVIISILYELSTKHYCNEKCRLQFLNSHTSVLKGTHLKKFCSYCLGLTFKKSKDKYAMLNKRIVSFKKGKSDKFDMFLTVKERELNQHLVPNYFKYAQEEMNWDVFLCIFKNGVQIQKRSIEVLSENMIPELMVSVSLEKHQIDSSASIVRFSINEAVIEIKEPNKKTDITEVQIGPFKGSITNYFGFDRPLSAELLKNFSSKQPIQTFLSAVGREHIISWVPLDSEELVSSKIREHSLLHFREQSWETQNLLKLKDLTFLEVFKQIGGLKSIFYVMQRLNRNCAQTLQDSLQHFLLQILAILHNLTKSDTEGYFLKEVSTIYQSMCQFLHLLFRKNIFISQYKSCIFVEAFFKFLLFYSPTQSKENVRNEQIFGLQLKFLKDVLCNFQIWSESSFQIQSYVFLTLESFLKSEEFTLALFHHDVHGKILSSVAFFYSHDENSSPMKLKIQKKTLTLCETLYQKLESVSLTQQKMEKGFNKKVSRKEGLNLIEKYIHRDVNQCMSLIYSLLTFHSSKASGYRGTGGLLCNYMIRNFILKSANFKIINQDWGYVLFIVGNLLIGSLCSQDPSLFSKLLELGFRIIEYRPQSFNWMTTLFERTILDEKEHQFKTIFDKVVEIVNLNRKFKFEIYQTLFYLLVKKLLICSPESVRDFFMQKNFQKILFRVVDTGLTFASSFIEFFEKLLNFAKNMESSTEPSKNFSSEVNLKLPQQSFQEDSHSQVLLKSDLPEMSRMKSDIIDNANQKETCAEFSQSKKRIMEALWEYANIIFEMCYETGVVQVGNRNWFLSYFGSQQQNKLFSIKRPNVKSNYRLANLCVNSNALNFYKLNCEKLFTKVQEQMLTEHDLVEECVLFLFFLSNPDWTVADTYSIITDFSAQISSTTAGKKASFSTFISLFAFAKGFKYLLQKYCHSPEKQQLIEKPLEAVNRKKITLTVFDMLLRLFPAIDAPILIKTTELYKTVEHEEIPLIFVFSNSSIEGTKEKSVKSLKTLKSHLQKFTKGISEVSFQSKTSEKGLYTFDKQKITELVLKLKQISVIKDQEQKTQAIFSYLDKRTSGQAKDSHETLDLYLKIVSASQFYLNSKRTQMILQHPDFFMAESNFIEKPRDCDSVIGQAEGEAYQAALAQKFNRLLELEKKRVLESESCWKKLERQNEFWLQIDLKNRDLLYELDEKETGPFGLYKLGVKPVKIQSEKAAYPRKKMPTQIILDNEDQELIDSDDSSLDSKSKIFQFDNVNHRVRKNTLLQPKFLSNRISKEHKGKSNERAFYCEYVTKKGIYAGQILVKETHLQFKYLSHHRLPEKRAYRMSTAKYHQINEVSEEEQKLLESMIIPYRKCQLYTRRYVLRPTAVELFEKISKKSYFFNLFYSAERANFLKETGSKFKQCIIERKQVFEEKRITESWQSGTISNFEYLCLLNRYSGRSTNDLAQYMVMPWVIANHSGKDGYTELNEEFLKNTNNLRNLEHPPGKLNPEKFNKLKTRLMELEGCDREDRFLYGTMFSNPTVLYNFFIRLQPFIRLHWDHQGKRIDHADRLFSGIEEQYQSVLTASSDMKEITPEFFYWAEFLKNRNSIDLGQKQNKQEVNDVVLPIWAKSPEEYIFKMRYALESKEVSSKLHLWIDLVFGFKIEYKNAEVNDNLYHFNCYEQQDDYFETYSDEKDIRSLQVSISEFGQVPESLFTEPHPPKNVRETCLCISQILPIKFKIKDKNISVLGFQTSRQGIMIWSDKQVEFKKAYIDQNYSWDEENKIYPSKGEDCRIMSFQAQIWVTLKDGLFRIYNKKQLKLEKLIDSETFETMGSYFIYSKKSQIFIDLFDGLSLSNLSVLYGHKQEVFSIRCSKQLDILVSVDLQGFVMVHELTNLEYLRSFQLSLEREWDFRQIREKHCKNRILKMEIHEMGYFIFLVNNKRLIIYTFLGELLVQQELEVTRKIKEEEEITCMKIFAQDRSLLLFSTSRGNIYEVDFIECKRYSSIYPYKVYCRIENNVLAEAQRWNENQQKSRLKIDSAIVNFTVEKNPGEKFCLYQIVVQYQNGLIACFYEEKYLGKQLKQNQKLKQLGLFF